MHDFISRDRLRPFLLDRLTDDQANRRPGSRIAAAAEADRGVDPAKFRERLKQDLIWLLNTQAPALREEVEKFPEVAKSVLNYGIPDLSQLISDNNVTGREVERWVARAIERFEPRILPQTLVVRLVAAADGGTDRPGALQLEIEGDVWAVPEPEPIYIRTEIDLGAGGCDIRDR